MIPAMNIVAWGRTVPWAEDRQVEQDLVICRALVEIFNDPFLKEQLRFRGGTALNKLHFPKPLRYSEDIDLTRTTEGGVGPVISALRKILEPWMGRGHYDLGLIGPKLTFTMKAEDKNATQPIRVKVEIATRERIAYEGAHSVKFEVKNPWFTGTANIATFTKEEILATKFRALLQRDKGRDLLDLAYAIVELENLDTARVVTCLRKYLAAADQAISRAEAEQRMFQKLDDPTFLADVRPLLSADEAEKFDDATARAAFELVFREFIKRIPGEAWAQTADRAQEFGMSDLVKE
jgi:predicted nucleotidyltransferase component of viral defense system